VAYVRLKAFETDYLSQVFDAVAAELANQEIWVHLDNHVSKAQWCCGADDGNAWFGGEYTHADMSGTQRLTHLQTRTSTLQSGCVASATWLNTLVSNGYRPYVSDADRT
jgi:hypothetical protein